jgi:threonine dehydratase
VPASDLPINITDVEQARTRIEGLNVVTPLIENAMLNERIGGRLLIKPEMLQVTGSFKFRGACNALASLSDAARARGVIAYSSGNHAQGVAAAARMFATQAVIVMPDDAPAVKRAGTESWGAEIVTYDRKAGESREEKAAGLARARGLELIRPYDEPAVMAGQGTAGLEIADQAAAMGVEPDVVLIPCGGGGLTAGIATAITARCPQATVHPVEPANFDDTARSLAAGERRRNSGPETGLCDALLAPEPGQLTFEVNRRLCGAGLSVSDDEVLDAMFEAFSRLKLVAEPGGAVALAAALAGKLDLAGKTAVVVMSGGNVDPAVFRQMLEQRA